jgi:anti-sigma B factor antagonist
VAPVDELQPLRIASARFGADSYVLALAGELDIATSERFERELDVLLDQGARRLVVDLLALTFLGSVGLGLLTRAANRTRAIGGDCIVVTDDPRILRVFEITGLDRIYRIERSLMEAVERLVGTRAAVA